MSRPVPAGLNGMVRAVKRETPSLTEYAIQYTPHIGNKVFSNFFIFRKALNAQYFEISQKRRLWCAPDDQTSNSQSCKLWISNSRYGIPRTRRVSSGAKSRQVVVNVLWRGGESVGKPLGRDQTHLHSWARNLFVAPQSLSDRQCRR